MIDRPSAVPLNIHEQGNEEKGDLASALNLAPPEERPSTPSDSSISNNTTNQLSIDTHANASPNFSTSNSSQSTINASQHTSGSQSQRRTSQVERIMDCLFPSREEMMAQSNTEINLSRECLNSDMHMTAAHIDLAGALRQSLT